MRKFKISVLLLFVLTRPILSFSQVSMGVRAGLNLAKVTYSFQGVSLNYDRISTFTMGVPIEIKLTDNFALQPELNYTTKGGEYITSLDLFGSIVSLEEKIKISYLEIPFLAKISVGNPKIKLDLFAGPVIGYGLSGSDYLKVVDNGSVQEQTHELDFEDDQVSRIDFSINIGAGTSITAGANRLFFDIHYQAGLSNMNSEDASSGNSVASIKNNNIIFSIGFLTPLTTPKPAPQPQLK